MSTLCLPVPVPRQLQAGLLSMLIFSCSGVPCFEGCWHVVLDFVFLLVGKLWMISESPKGLVPVSLELCCCWCFRLPAHSVNCNQAPPRILNGLPTPTLPFVPLLIFSSQFTMPLKEDVNPHTQGVEVGESELEAWDQPTLHSETLYQKLINRHAYLTIFLKMPASIVFPLCFPVL